MLPVLYEDEKLLALSKLRGMASVRLRESDPLTVSDLVTKYCKNCRNASPDEREGGLVQRLDFWTSGAILAAKDQETWNALHAMLKQEKVKKTYLALVQGIPTSKHFTINAPFSLSKGKKIVKLAKARDKKSLSAHTDIEVVYKKTGRSPWSIVRATMSRGRRHQVRAHLASVGHPLVGDEQYGSTFQLDKVLPEVGDGFLLHAETILLKHPYSGKKLAISAPSREFENLVGERK